MSRGSAIEELVFLEKRNAELEEKIANLEQDLRFADMFYEIAIKQRNQAWKELSNVTGNEVQQRQTKTILSDGSY